jgi:hypothetical protein
MFSLPLPLYIWNECSRLIANAVIYFNHLVLSHVIDGSTGSIMDGKGQKSGSGWGDLQFIVASLNNSPPFTTSSLRSGPLHIMQH